LQYSHDSKVLVKLAQKLYDLDSVPNKGNKAFKGLWPFTVLWRRCVLFAGKSSPLLAQEILADISDPEIAAN